MISANKTLLRTILFVLLACGAPVFADEAAPSPSPSPAASVQAVPRSDFEIPGKVDAADFLPKSAFAGKGIYAGKTAENDGLQNTYRIRSGAKEYEVTGTESAITLIQELRAINELRRISKTDAFKSGLKESAEGKYRTAKEIVRDPVSAVKRVPEGASRFFGKVTGFFNRDEEDNGEGQSPGDALKGVLGVDKAKRSLAARLGVDVYSRNQALQAELDRVASAMAGGGLALNIGTMPIGGAVGAGLTIIGVDQSIQGLINDSSPEELRKWNEQKLAALGVNQDLIEQFLNHPWYSPRQETIITAALATIKANPDLFLKSANEALTPQDSQYFQHTAQLLAIYARKKAPISSLRLVEGIVCGLDADGVLIVPVSFDYGIWSESVAHRVNALADSVKTDQGIKKIEVWTDGKISNRASQELSKISIEYDNVPLTKGG